ncbi:hypothetical protein R3P38DRAFT_3400390 [Favolaschia claudopus]|uniref:Tyr recombinase domain-containing protein n=1 Tax=Favolaschia claudopus TaxID=2862362 RepID=A0AAW0AVM4_9AGAR
MFTSTGLDSTLVLVRKWLKSQLTVWRTRNYIQQFIPTSVGPGNDENFCNFRRAFDATPSVHSPEMVSLYLVYKIYGQGRKIGTADTIHAAFKLIFSDGDKYRGKWHFNPTTVAWVGNPIDSAKVQDTMVAIKNKCGMDGGDRKHSLAMSEEFMSRMFAWSDETCPASRYEEKSSTVEEQNLKTKHFGVQICFELIKLQRKHLTFGLEDSKAFNTPYFELQLTNRKGWQKRVNKTDKEADLRSGKFKICAQPDLPACDSFTWMTRWVKYLEEDIYKCPLNPDDYIFPATGANGIVQTGEHISHDDVQKWITEFAAGADLPRANGTFSTHCFRRGGAQYRFMFAPVRWWGGWAEGEHRDTLIKYLLDELNTYEDDYSGMLLPTKPDTDKSFLGEATSTAPAIAENITMLHQSLSADIRTLSTEFDALLRIVAAAVTAPASFASSHLLLISCIALTTGQPNAQPHLISSAKYRQFCTDNYSNTNSFHLTSLCLGTDRLFRHFPLVSLQSQPPALTRGRPLPDAWSDCSRHGDAEHGLTTSLKDWPKDWLRGTNKPLAMKHTQQRIIATEFIDHYKRDKQSFLEAYPEANQGRFRLLGAINKAREARGDRIARK